MHPQMIEIERKFLVHSDQFIAEAHAADQIAQGYLNSDPARSVRVRIKGGKSYLTIKGLGSSDGTSRFEWEQEIPLEDGKKLLAMCEKGRIEKKRYLVRKGKHTFEIDVFAGDNQGLVIAEIELNSEDEVFEKPAWLGEEVTGNEQYYNAALSQRPFGSW